MSRSRKDGKVHGHPRAGEGDKNRGRGAEWSSIRLGKCGWSQTGPLTKRWTHRAERRQAKKLVQQDD